MSTTDTGLVRHVYDGERCRFCGANVHDADMLGIECVPREAMTWTSETPAPDTERDERLREARALVSVLRRYPGDRQTPAVRALLVLEEEATRLDAVVTAVRDLVAELEATGDYGPYALLRRALDGGAS